MGAAITAADPDEGDTPARCRERTPRPSRQEAPQADLSLSAGETYTVEAAGTPGGFTLGVGPQTPSP